MGHRYREPLKAHVICRSCIHNSVGWMCFVVAAKAFSFGAMSCRLKRLTNSDSLLTDKGFNGRHVEQSVLLFYYIFFQRFLLFHCSVWFTLVLFRFDIALVLALVIFILLAIKFRVADLFEWFIRMLIERFCSCNLCQIPHYIGNWDKLK